MERKNKWSWFSIFLLIIFFAWIINYFNIIKYFIPQTPEQSFQGENKIDEPQVQPKKTSAELLKEAKKAINDKLESRPYGRLFDAEWRLKDIKPQDKEYMEAQKLLKEIDKISIRNGKRKWRNKK